MRKVLLLLTSLFALALGACTSPRSWVYSPEARQQRQPVMNASLAVPPMIDRRSNDNSNGTALYLIPLMPFGTQDYPAPEGASMHMVSGEWKFSPPDDFARAVAQEIDASRIFREAFTDSRSSAGDYVLQGEVISTNYNAKLISYGLSVYGPILWFVLPSSHYAEDIEVRLTLTRAGSEAPVWQHTMRGTANRTVWMYAPGTDFMYDQMLKSAMPEMLASLEAAVRSRPQGL